MATVTHHIHSHYEPPIEDEGENVLEDRTEEDELDPWLTESAFGAIRRLKAAPHFVPAIVSYDEVNDMIGGASSSVPRAEEPSSSSQVSDWYKTLPRSSSTPITFPQASPTAASSTLNLAQSARSSPAPPSGQKNNWFTTKPIGHRSSPSTSAPTIADILSREPPPDCKDQPFVPPVFLHIGPSNKGFIMLQQGGWREGEALGASAARRAPIQKAREKQPAEIIPSKKHSVKMEERAVAIDDDGEILEVRKVEVMDLTLSDSDSDEDLDCMDSHETTASSNAVSDPSTPDELLGSHNPTALLTPIATVLKSDRLGIGLKAKTVGPYKESKKRVTHNQAALAAHIRANEEMRLRKTLLGRGVKFFARLAKADEERRRQLLASLNAG